MNINEETQKNCRLKFGSEEHSASASLTQICLDIARKDKDGKISEGYYPLTSQQCSNLESYNVHYEEEHFVSFRQELKQIFSQRKSRENEVANVISFEEAKENYTQNLMSNEVVDFEPEPFVSKSRAA